MLQRHFMRFNKLIASNNIPSLRPETKIDSYFNKNIIATQQQHGLLYNNINVCVFVWVLRATPYIWCVIHFSSCFAAYYAVAIMNTHTHNITICLVIFFSCFFTTAFRFFNSREYHVFLSFFFSFFFLFLSYLLLIILLWGLVLSVWVYTLYTMISFIADLLGDLLEGFSFVSHTFQTNKFYIVILCVHCFRLFVMLWHFFRFFFTLIHSPSVFFPSSMFLFIYCTILWAVSLK